MDRKEYIKLSDYKIGKIYHAWIKKNGYMPFVPWEMQVLANKIKIGKS